MNLLNWYQKLKVSLDKLNKILLNQRAIQMRQQLGITPAPRHPARDRSLASWVTVSSPAL